MITPLEIQNKEFKKAMRGYKEDEVDVFLDQVMIDYEKLYKENMELKEKLELAHHQMDKYKDIEETLKNLLNYIITILFIILPLSIKFYYNHKSRI